MTNDQAPMTNEPSPVQPLHSTFDIRHWDLVIGHYATGGVALVPYGASIYDVSFPSAPLAAGGGTPPV